MIKSSEKQKQQCKLCVSTVVNNCGLREELTRCFRRMFYWSQKVIGPTTVFMPKSKSFVVNIRSRFISVLTMLCMALTLSPSLYTLVMLSNFLFFAINSLIKNSKPTTQQSPRDRKSASAQCIVGSSDKATYLLAVEYRSNVHSETQHTVCV